MTEQDMTALQQGENLRRAQDALVGDMPMMEPPADTIVTLPRGLYLGGEWLTEVEVRELDGEDEEYLAKFKDLNDYFDQLIVRGTVRIGNVALEDLSLMERQGYLGNLLAGEREKIMIAIAIATYGDRKEFTLKCPKCGVEFVFDLLLSEDIKFAECEDLQHLSFHYTTGKGEIEYRLLTGADQLDFVKRPGTVAEKNTFLLSKLIVKFKGQILPDPVHFAKKLSMRDRGKLLGLLTDKQQPSANTVLSIPCPSCGEVTEVGFPWWDFFRP